MPQTKNSIASRLPSWQALWEKKQLWDKTTLADEFNKDSRRASTFSLSACDLFLDYSKNHINAETLDLLVQLTKEASLKDKINELFSGEKINNTENRKVLHTALRSPRTSSEEEQAVHGTLKKMSAFVDKIHSQEWRGFSGKAITDIVNIGIGGSDLGPRMATAALTPFHVSQIKVHFVANVDGADISTCLAGLNPKSTLFIVASKSFTTLETLENAKSARHWMKSADCADNDIAKHFVSITANVRTAVEFGIDENNIFPMWDWVGGRYSLWSAIGLPIALAIGFKEFKNLLQGAHEMDEHFRNAEAKNNLPVIQALIAFWYNQFWDAQSQVILPYNNLLQHFPAFLQQLDMESLGKSVDRDGGPVDGPTGMIIWGSEGTNGQHSFHQLLHQGNRCVPADFIINKRSQYELEHQQEHLIACCLSQSQALLQGKSLAQATQKLLDAGLDAKVANVLAKHKVIPGNRPSSTLIMDELSPKNLGALIALYEHKVFVLSVLSNTNAFDQWGVELGKQLSGPIYAALTSSKKNELDKLDGSTQQLIDLLSQ